MNKNIIIREEWYSNHKRCPCCSGNVVISTHIVAWDHDTDFEDNVNTYWCTRCGSGGDIKELIP